MQCLKCFFCPIAGGGEAPGGGVRREGSDGAREAGGGGEGESQGGEETSKGTGKKKGGEKTPFRRWGKGDLATADDIYILSRRPKHAFFPRKSPDEGAAREAGGRAGGAAGVLEGGGGAAEGVHDQEEGRRGGGKSMQTPLVPKESFKIFLARIRGTPSPSAGATTAPTWRTTARRTRTCRPNR